MGLRGPAPTPAELKVRRGNPGKRALPAPLTVIGNLSRADDLPALATGEEMLQHVLDHGGKDWIGPTDVSAHVAVSLWNAWRLAETKWTDTGELDDFKQFKGLTEELNRCLGKLGLTPTDRSSLGLAHVKAKSKLEEMRERRRERAGRHVG